MEKDKLIEALVKALGTMVESPEYESDPTEIGKKRMIGMIRKPILEGTNRDRVIDCLVATIEEAGTKVVHTYKMDSNVDYKIPKLNNMDTRLNAKTGETEHLVSGDVVMVTPSESTQALTWQADNK